jgi:hypothetical protein
MRKEDHPIPYPFLQLRPPPTPAKIASLYLPKREKKDKERGNEGKCSHDGYTG